VYNITKTISDGMIWVPSY